jgi:FkbM family methyltransferase
MDNFVITPFKYGDLLVNKNCNLQLETIVATGGTPHIEQELQNIFRVVDTLPDGALFVDGGTNIGLVTLPVARHTKGRINIISFEPQRMLFNCLCGSLALNEFYNVFPLNKALSDEVGYVTLPEVDYTAKSDYGVVTVDKKIEENEHKYLSRHTVEAITIDSMDLPRLDFLKLDIEGFELHAIRGAKETIKKYKPFLWVEYHILGLDAVKDCLNEIHNYEMIPVDWQNVLCVPR